MTPRTGPAKFNCLYKVKIKMSNYPFSLHSGSTSASPLDTLSLSSANSFGSLFFFNVHRSDS
ncbi:hypothetical protein CGJ10_18405 [Vibrio parahaemolyticus]|nr:hypothetical protein CGJ10_18405 [Vibrio parahaemolyticus]